MGNTLIAYQVFFIQQIPERKRWEMENEYCIFRI